MRRISRSVSSFSAVGSRENDERLILASFTGYDREPSMTGIDHHLPPIQAQRSKAFDKKSAPISWPILA